MSPFEAIGLVATEGFLAVFTTGWEVFLLQFLRTKVMFVMGDNAVFVPALAECIVVITAIAALAILHPFGASLAWW